MWPGRSGGPGIREILSTYRAQLPGEEGRRLRNRVPERYAVSISLSIREIPPSMPEKNATPFLLNES